MAFAMMSITLMNKGTHQRADVVGIVMAQVSLKAALKKWGCPEHLARIFGKYN
jgi:hypothetical protein